MALGLILVIIPFMLAQPSMARFLLMLNKGKWGSTTVLNEKTIAMPLRVSKYKLRIRLLMVVKWEKRLPFTAITMQFSGSIDLHQMILYIL
jgi:hypothetical protein